jgi:hypothetical protein
VSDPFLEAMRKANHWTQLAWAEAWAAVAERLADRPRAARRAWAHAAAGYDGYCEAYARNLPASRWDYDYGRECALAHEHADAPAPPPDATPLPPWIAAALGGRLDDAVREAPAPRDELELATLRALAIACDVAGRADDARRLRATIPA